MISIRDFYLIGAILMLISFLANLYNIVSIWQILTLASKISSVAGTLLFNLLLCSMFFWLWKTTPKNPMMIQENPELDKFIEEISKK